ncbi:MAG: hypothetical protein OEW65_05670 [Thermoleophilia bacterium]|nr:hypothetical protein [Thermoleophilia bacterium]
MPRLPNNMVTATIAWWVIRRRLRRSDNMLAPAGVAALELLGPRVLLARRLLAIAVGLTIVGLLALGLAWWLLHRRGADDGDDWSYEEPEPDPAPPAVEMDEPAPVGA